MVADEFQADVFTDLLELRSKIDRDVSERPPRQPRPLDLRPASQSSDVGRLWQDPVR
jgi:hypothetical protein